MAQAGVQVRYALVKQIQVRYALVKQMQSSKAGSKVKVKIPYEKYEKTYGKY